MPNVDPVILQLRADVDGYNRKVDQAQKLTAQKLDAIEASGARMGAGLKKGFDLAKGAAIGYVGALGVEAITNAIAKGLEYASSLGEVAQQLGVTTDALQEYRYAGSQAGLTVEETDQALAQLTRRLGEAANGTKAQAEAFEKLGIEVKDANGEVIDAGKAIPLIAEALKGVHSPAERAAVLTDLFGRAGQKLEPLLSEGAAGVNNLRNAAHELGVVLSEEQIQNADRTADKLSELKQVLEVKIAAVVADNAGAIVTLANALADLVNWIGRVDQAFTRFQGTMRSLKAVGRVAIRGPAGLLNLESELETANRAPRTGAAPAPRRAIPIPAVPPLLRKPGGGYTPGLGPLKANFAGGSVNPFGEAGANGAAALVLLTSAAAEALPIIEGITAELDAELQRKQNHADLEVDALEAEAAIARTREEREAIERRILEIRQQAETDELEAAIAAGEYADAAKARADLARKQNADRTAATRGDAGPLARYADSLGDPRRDVEEAVVRKLEDVNRGITDAIAKEIGAKDPFIKELLSILLNQLLFKPLAEMLSQAAAGSGGSGGILGGVVSAIGGLFGGGNGGFAGARAGGGPVMAGRLYRVNEGASPGRVEGFIPRGSGEIIPLGRMNALAPRQSAPTIIQPIVNVDARGAVMNDEFARMMKSHANQAAGQAYRQAVKDAPRAVQTARRYGQR